MAACTGGNFSLQAYHIPSHPSQQRLANCPTMQIPKQSLADKVALVTGAGAGIGKASAKLLAHAGAAVTLVGTTLEHLKETEEEIHHSGGRALSVQGDVTSADQVALAVRTSFEAWGQLDILHHNAGINGMWAPFEELEEAEWDATLNTNLKGTFLVLKHCFPHLKAQGGSVIVTSSVNGTRMFSNTGASAYATSKAAQLALVKMLALEWARHRVRVNAICPGAIETTIAEETYTRNLDRIRVPVHFPEGSIPLKDGEPGSSGQVAQLVWFLASDASSHITGTEIYIDGGESLLEG